MDVNSESNWSYHTGSEHKGDVRVSVIIATKDNPDKIHLPIESLLSGTVVPDEIVVSDQSRGDATRQGVAQFEKQSSRILYSRCSVPGLSANRNAALARTSGAFIASVDDDVEVDDRWLERMLDEWTLHWNREPVLITGRIGRAPRLDANARVTALRESGERSVFRGTPKATGVLIGAQFGASRELFEFLGPDVFDEQLGVGSRYPGADDDEFAYRVMRSGFAVVYEPSIRVTHHTERTDSAWRRLRYRRCIGNGAAVAKHFWRGDLHIIGDLVSDVGANAAKGIRSLARRDVPEGTARILGALGLIVGFWMWTIDRLIRWLSNS